MSDPLQGGSIRPGRPAAMGTPALWPPILERSAHHEMVAGQIKMGKDLPLFCDPLVIFVGNWVLMVISLSPQITYVTYPHMGMPLELFGISLASFLVGYFGLRKFLRGRAAAPEIPAFKLDVTLLWRLNLILCLGALIIIAFNWALSGPPPALGDPTSYLRYGRFKQVLFPLLVIVTVNAVLDTVRWRRALFMVFGIAGMTLYVTRGLLMVSLVQMFFVFSLKTRISTRRLYTILICFIAFAIIVITVIGNARTAQDVFLEYLQIRLRYSHWPMAYLWLTSYVSIPFSNLCWIFANGSFHRPTFSFLYPLLPSFLAPPDPHAYIHGDPRIIDGASTYLVAYALDFWYLGIGLANVALGMGCGWLRERALPRGPLVAAILFTCLSFIFFSDMFTPLSTILQIAIQVVVQRKCFHWESEQMAGMVSG